MLVLGRCRWAGRASAFVWPDLVGFVFPDLGRIAIAMVADLDQHRVLSLYLRLEDGAQRRLFHSDGSLTLEITGPSARTPPSNNLLPFQATFSLVVAFSDLNLEDSRYGLAHLNLQSYWKTPRFFLLKQAFYCIKKVQILYRETRAYIKLIN